jgi:hypothetical protein
VLTCSYRQKGTQEENFWKVKEGKKEAVEEGERNGSKRAINEGVEFKTAKLKRK